MGTMPWISSAPQGRADLLHVINSVLFLCEELTYLAVSIDDRWHSRHASAEDRHRRRCWPLRSHLEFIVVCEGNRPWDGACGVYADEVDSSER
jgi:hypothetical protein